ncbi:beta-glucosidase BglX [Granulicella arctica]|uniref:beta-glucosidase n=1 Tax=Granulicella arctica TaxID=940613 RepID=A0A7Y9TGI1_9BACT|nr:beta-glucosidase BglX [Granulicella arctica]NYF78775.1 beta-glucosidase [Granulicella arctica]
MGPCTARLHLRNLLFAATLPLTIAAIGQTTPQHTPQNGPRADIFTPATIKRADALLKQMTTDEKLGQLNQLFVFDPSASIDDFVRKGQVGSLLFVTDPASINRFQHLAVDNSRLHIPLIFGFDVIHGFRTIFPIPLAMASSWDPETVERAQTIAAAEARSVGIDWAFAPMLDIARDPRWGRIMEGAGEDPYLGAAIARAQVRGFQGPAIGTPDHLLACMKHFAGYGAAEGGRDYDASYISDAQLHNVYLPPFHAAVEAGVGSVMSAYMDLNDIPATGNHWLQTEVLRDDWGFQGFVVSDANAVKSLENHGFAKDPADAALRAFNAGVNMEMAIDKTAYSTLPDAYKQGRITLKQIDAAVKPILEAKIQLGLFENPYVDLPHSQQVLNDPAHRVEALRAAEHSAVLRRNENNLLPLAKSTYKSIAVIGPLANGKHDTIGSWAFQEDPNEAVTVLEGLHAKLDATTKIDYAPGVQIKRFFPSFFDEIFHEPKRIDWTPEQAKAEFDKAVDLARSSDLTILTLGETQDMSGEAASRSSLALPGEQEKLLETIASLNKPVVLVLLNGRPLDITWASEHIPAILEAWYPGTQGGTAIANLLTGDAVPGGKLPLSWPRNVGQIPINYTHNLTQDASKQGERYWNEPSTPLYPFGYGLSYSAFSFSNLKVTEPENKVGQPVHVSVDVENTGSIPADEVAQLYIHQQYGSASRPVRELKGFRRITLAPHAKTTVDFTLTPADLSYWNAGSRSWVQDASTFDLWAGDSSAATLHTTFNRAR